MSDDVLGNSALAAVAGPLKTFWEKLGGKEGRVWLAAFKRFLRKENPWDISTDPKIIREKLISALNQRAIQIPALPRPTLEQFQAKSSWIKEIECDNSPTGPVTLKLINVLQDGEEQLSGQEFEQRLKDLTGQLGYQQFEWLVANQDKYPEFMALLGQIYLEGPAIIVVDQHGIRHVACLDRGGKRWCLEWRWLSNDFVRRGQVAVSDK